MRPVPARAGTPPPFGRSGACMRCGAAAEAELCAPCTANPAGATRGDPAVLEPLGLVSLLAALTPWFVAAPDALAVSLPGRAVALRVELVAVAAGALAIALAGTTLALARGTRAGAARTRLVATAWLAIALGAYALGSGLGGR